jgi:hypothetical protein
MAGTKRILAFSCLHGILAHKLYFGWLIGQIEAYRPHYVVNGGDWYEGTWAKKWPKHEDETWNCLDEHKAVASQATAIRAAAPRAELWWLYGNHDSNCFEPHPDRAAQDARLALHWEENKDASKALSYWNVVKKYGHDVFKRLGPVTFQHGCELSKAGIRRETVYYSTPFGLRVSGHTHRPTDLEQLDMNGAPLPYWQINPGFGADADRMHYVDRLNKQNWGRGCVLIEAHGVEQSRSAYASKQWDAELRVHSMLDSRFSV